MSEAPGLFASEPPNDWIQRQREQGRQSSPLPWRIHRNPRNWNVRWYQRWIEAWWAVTGRYTLWHAYHDGKHEGMMAEYHRTVVMGGR